MRGIGIWFWWSPKNYTAECCFCLVKKLRALKGNRTVIGCIWCRISKAIGIEFKRFARHILYSTPRCNVGWFWIQIQFANIENFDSNGINYEVIHHFLNAFTKMNWLIYSNYFTYYCVLLLIKLSNESSQLRSPWCKKSDLLGPDIILTFYYSREKIIVAIK